MKNIFVMTGEHSGDLLGAWYVKRLRSAFPDLSITGVGGKHLEKEGTILHDSITNYSVVGIIEIIKKLPKIFAQLSKLTTFITTNDFDTVILVDYPGFNLRLLQRLKKAKPNLYIIYVAPPQLWVWGKWRLKPLRQYCDKIVVMYPFEVAWYKKQEMTVFYEGNPLLDRLAPFMQPQPKENKLMFLPGSRHQEIKTLMPIFVELIVKIKAAYPELMIGIARAESIPQEELLSYFPHEQICKNVFTIVEPQEKYPWLQQAFLAIAKPGTCTLELALLNTPSIIAYKVNPFTYWLARAVVCIDYMALPNLFLEKPVYKEFLQSDCNIESLYTEIENQYQDFLYHPTKYAKQLEELTHLKNHFLLIKYS